MITLPSLGPSTRSVTQTEYGNGNLSGSLPKPDHTTSHTGRRGSLSPQNYATASNRPEAETDSSAHTPSEPLEPLIIPFRSRHYTFALLVHEGYEYDEACDHVGVSPKTAEGWRCELKKAAAQIFGRKVSYYFAVRYAFESMGKSGHDRKVLSNVQNGPRAAERSLRPPV